MPSLSVVQTRAVAPKERCARALLAAEPERAVDQALDEPFESHRDLHQRPPQLRGDPVDHAAAHHRLADARRAGHSGRA